MGRPNFVLFGIPVTVSLWHFLWMLLLLGWPASRSLGGVGALLLMLLGSFSVLAHELGHGLLSKFYRLDPEIYLVSLGGFTRHAPARGLGQQFAIVAAGPAVNFLLAVLGYLVADYLPPQALGLGGMFIWLNVIWGIYNLLPVWPLDGGQLMRIGFLRFLLPVRAERWTHVASMVVGAVLAVVLLNMGQTFAALFLGMSVFQNWQMLQAVEDSSAAKVHKKHGGVRELVEQARAAYAEGDFAASLRLGHLARNEPYLSPVELEHIWQLLALSAARLASYDEALRYAERVPRSPDMAQVQAHCLQALGDAVRIRRFLTSPAALLLPGERIEQLQELVRLQDLGRPQAS